MACSVPPWACLIDDYVTRYHASYTPELRDEHNLINTTMLGKLGVYSAQSSIQRAHKHSAPGL